MVVEKEKEDVKEKDKQDKVSGPDKTDESSTSDESSTADVKDAETETETEAETETEKESGAVEEEEERGEEKDRIPRWRLNEELDRRHSAETRVKELEQRLNQMESQVGITRESESLEKELDTLAEETTLPKDSLKKLFQLQNKIVNFQIAKKDESDSVVLAKTNVRHFVSLNPKAVQYEAEIEKRLMNLAPHLRSDPETVPEIYRYIRGADIERIEREAEERGKRKGLENKKIVSRGTKESGTVSSEESHSKKIVLTEDEKRVAEQYEMTEEEYANYKAKKRHG